MKIALVQMDVVHGQPVENKKHVIEMLERALDDNPDVIVLPEMWNTGYALDELNGLADKEGLDSQELLSHFARKHAVAIIGGSVAIEKDGKFYNTTYVYNKSGGPNQYLQQGPSLWPHGRGPVHVCWVFGVCI